MTENIKKKIEDKIIDLAAVGAGGRLVVVKPENQAEDLIIAKKGDYKKKVFSFNVYGDDISPGQSMEDEILRLSADENINREDGLYLIFVRFDIVKQDIEENFWVIPSLKLQKISDSAVLKNFETNKKKFIRFLIELFEKK